MFTVYKLIILSLISLLSLASGAQNIYVAANGNDASSGSSEAPYLTIQKAANIAQVGDTIWIRGGTYRESVSLSRDGTAEQHIVFSAYPGEEVIISGCDLLTGWSELGNGIWEAPMQ